MARITKVVDDMDHQTPADHVAMLLRFGDKAIRLDLCEKNRRVLSELLEPWFSLVGPEAKVEPSKPSERPTPARTGNGARRPGVMRFAVANGIPMPGPNPSADLRARYDAAVADGSFKP